MNPTTLLFPDSEWHHTPVSMMEEEGAKEMRPISLWGPSNQDWPNRFHIEEPLDFNLMAARAHPLPARCPPRVCSWTFRVSVWSSFQFACLSALHYI